MATVVARRVATPPVAPMRLIVSSVMMPTTGRLPLRAARLLREKEREKKQLGSQSNKLARRSMQRTFRLLFLGRSDSFEESSNTRP